MEFLITSYIYPLEEPILLSPSLGFRLDNPRSDLEIETLKEYLLRAYESGYDYKFPIHTSEPIISLESILLNFRDTFKAENEYIAQIFEHYDRENVFHFIASIWIIARFDDEGVGNILRQEHQEMQERGEVGIFLLDDDHILVQKSKSLANYCSLLSLLIHTEESSYFGKSFLVDPEPIAPHQSTAEVWTEFFSFGIAIHSFPQSQDELRWLFLPNATTMLKIVADQLEKIFDNGLSEKMLYIGEILKMVSHNTQDTKARIVLLTSILELLVTHSPDFNRFNVEDSISKQFQLKVSLLVYLNNKNNDLNTVKTRLKTIYQQRSNIAHGNFSAVEKYVKNLSKKEGKEEYFDDLVTDLYLYVRAILEEYLKDPKLVEFIKEN